ncbi:bifunctional folylpolyglutamate synthase/dihydrofolate synthase [Polluticoccus soli]|uniref:bifunctional folylpolyglutamate synthase/dihydrofolate synthase n=1 Tax=Polluticoccus soli TaxID=3034150 RepID=UPI0023E15669|nr:folylpolyglutamate synthase/dihydrofolate synthase family protein [Flavipsychrobacter sp. JY13-12]
MNTQAAYNDTIDYLYERLPQFSKQGAAAIKKDLVNITSLCEALGEPYKKFKSVHIAGTNGKGSTSHMLAAILQQSGYRVGLYTSPHLIDFRERIRIDGQQVSKDWVVDFVEKNKKLIEQVEPSFFEVTVAMAFQAFAENEVDFAIIETGLGGRLDSTNIIEPILSIITNISYDHMDVLGNTLEQIAIEKAGIIKAKVPVIIGQQHSETERVFFEQSIHKQSTLYYADAQWDLVRVKQDQQYQYFKAIHRAKMEMFDLKTDLKGNYQVPNIKTALAAIDILKTNHGLNISKENIILALGKVKRLTGLKGRWDIVQQQPLIIADVAHNPAGLKEVLAQWDNVKAKDKHIVLGFVKDKDVSAALSLFPTDNTYYFCQAQIPRALNMNELKQLASEKGLEGKVYPTVDEAVKAARNAAGNTGAVLITGSFFIVGEGLEYLSVNNGLLFPTTLE